MAQVLLVADSRAAVGLRPHLCAAGFGVEVVEELQAPRASALADVFDAVIVDDSSLRDGLGVVRVVRASGNLVPIVLLSADDTPENRARGLDAGADSYFTRPYSALVLVAQVRAHIRRSMRRQSEQATAARHDRSSLRVNVVERSVSNGEKQVFLSPRENALVRALAYRQGAYVSAGNLLRMVWGEGFGNVHVVASCVRQVRHRFAELGSRGLIESRRGSGYRLSRRVTVVTSPPGVPVSRGAMDGDAGNPPVATGAHD